MITAIAVLAYLLFYGIFAYCCEKFSPLVMFAGLLLVMIVAEALAALGLGG